MFTPPPSPMPFSGAEESSSPSSSLLVAPENGSEYPFPSVPSPPESPCIAEAVPSRILSLDLKKRSGKRTLLFVALLPATLVLSAWLRHFVRIPATLVLDEPSAMAFEKREPQTIDLAPSGTPTPTLSDSPPPTPSNSLSPSNTPTSASAVPTVPVVAPIPTPFPQPFDASLTANFSTLGCEAFFQNFTQEEDFRQCRSFSFLLNTSAAFLQAQRNLTLINSVIWGTCNTIPTAETCDATMASYLSQLNDVCKEDLADENPVALQAQIGFQSYTAMRMAACLPDASTNAYCYVDAVAATPPADIYFYALPLGTPFPNTTNPSCSPCVQSVLAVYAQYVNPSGSGSGAVHIGSSTGNSSASAVKASPLPVLSKTYPAAARLAIDKCGGTYASVGVADPNGALQYRIAWGGVLVGLVLGSWTL